MVKQLLVSTALAAFMVAPVLAQENNSTQPAGQTPTMQTPPPAPEAKGAPPPPPAPTARAQPAPPPAATAEQQVTPPPADAIIPAEKMTDMRADKLIGTTVYNAEGEKVGSVNDIVF